MAAVVMAAVVVCTSALSVSTLGSRTSKEGCVIGGRRRRGIDRSSIARGGRRRSKERGRVMLGGSEISTDGNQLWVDSEQVENPATVRATKRILWRAISL